MERIVRLDKSEIEVIRHALYLHREMLRAQERLALDQGSQDCDRLGKLIWNSLSLDSKLSDVASDVPKYLPSRHPLRRSNSSVNG